jgi:hypothetical protein
LVFGFFAAWYYLFPKLTGYAYSDLPGRIHFWFLAIGGLIVILVPPQILLVARTVEQLSDVADLLRYWILMSRIGSYVSAASTLVFVANMVLSFLRKPPLTEASKWSEMSQFVEGFGCRPIAAMRLAPWPASETLNRSGRAASGNVRPLENCLPRKIERKARLATFNIVHEFLQSIRAALAFQRSQWQGGLRGRGCQKVAQTLKQCSLIFTSRDHRQATFWSLLAEVLEEPAVT